MAPWIEMIEGDDEPKLRGLVAEGLEKFYADSTLAGYVPFAEGSFTRIVESLAAYDFDELVAKLTHWIPTAYCRATETGYASLTSVHNNAFQIGCEPRGLLAVVDNPWNEKKRTLLRSTI